MKRTLPLAFWLLAVAAFAQETPSPNETPPAKADYTELSKMIRGIVLKSAPKEFNDTASWGQSTPFPPKLKLPGLPRTTIKVGDRVELAHGTWKKAKVWMENPERDFALTVTDIKPLEASKYRIAITSVAPLLVDYELQQWLNGLRLVAVDGRAKVKVRVDLECDATLSLNALKFPPEVTVTPKIASTKIEIEEFEAFDPATAKRPGLAVDLNEQIRGAIQGLVRGAEPQIQDEANKAIAQALRDGKGTFSATKLFEAIKK